jgi:hypothetical protein
LIWEKLIDLSLNLELVFDNNAERYKESNLDKFNQNGWKNITWKSKKFRRIHMDIVDARETKKLWMMHVCIFPNINSDAPIYGFDVISGSKKITGAFYDFSPVSKTHSALDYFKLHISKTDWEKKRELPEWAKQIFSENILAVGNIKNELEINQLSSIVLETTDWYLNEMDVSNYFNSLDAQNKYAQFQKQNPHTPRTMKSLGLDDEDVTFFINKCLFPDIINARL